MIQLTNPGETLVVGEEGFIGEGVRGYAMEEGGFIYIPLVFAEREGSGEVGRFLDSLPWGLCKFPCVVSRKLEGMLIRRGFTLHIEQSEFGEEVEVYQQKTSMWRGSDPSTPIPWRGEQ